MLSPQNNRECVTDTLLPFGVALDSTSTFRNSVRVPLDHINTLSKGVWIPLNN